MLKKRKLYIFFLTKNYIEARVAQLVERPAVNRQVPGSSPGPGANFYFVYT